MKAKIERFARFQRAGTRIAAQRQGVKAVALAKVLR
jgi:hypothetical protein